MVQGVANTIFIFTSYADGRPARTRLTINGQPEIETGKLGVASFEIMPETDNVGITVDGTMVDVKGTMINIKSNGLAELSSAAILTLRGVSKSYGDVKAAQDVNLEIPRGSIYGFLGPNGAGKTTTIRSIMNIILPDEGEVLLAGRALDGDLRDRIGYLPEERGLYKKMKKYGMLESKRRQAD